MASMAKQAKELEEQLAIEVCPTKRMKLASSEAKSAHIPQEEGWLLRYSLLYSRRNFQNVDTSANSLHSVVEYAMPREEESDQFSADSELGFSERISSVNDGEERLNDADEDFYFNFDTIQDSMSEGFVPFQV
jgi:hypothetical protein